MCTSGADCVASNTANDSPTAASLRGTSALFVTTPACVKPGLLTETDLVTSAYIGREAPFPDSSTNTIVAAAATPATI